MVRWLLEAGCPRGHFSVSAAVGVWPRGSGPAESEQLAEAVQLLAAAGWPPSEAFGHPLMAAVTVRHPWAVVRALLELQQDGA